MIQASFFDCDEIRMGSPYQIYQIERIGEWFPLHLMGRDDWVKFEGHNRDGRYFALAFWETVNNEPWHSVVLIDSAKRCDSSSERLQGCCESLQFELEKLQWGPYPGLG